MAREMLLLECARSEGPRGTRGSCPADQEVEAVIRARLLEAQPGWGYLGEETGLQLAAPGEPHVWVVDPNDGTTWMQRGYRGHAVSIAVVRNGLPVLGVVYAVDAPDDLGDLFTWAEGCGPARRNGVELPMLEAPEHLKVEDVVLVSQAADNRPLGNLSCVAPARFVGVSSIAYRLALAAGGDGVAAVSLHTPSAWDFAAGHALLRGVGGTLVDTHGQELHYVADGHSPAVMGVFGGSASVARELAGRDWSQIGSADESRVAAPESLARARPEPTQLIHDAEQLQRAQGCLLGQLAGDALGALVEFSSAGEIARRYPDGGPRLLAGGGPHHIAAGQPTDDSELALLLGRTLLRSERFDQEAVAGAYARWYHGWAHEPLASCKHRECGPFDIGSTTARALEAIASDDIGSNRAARQAEQAASRESQANGALMRVSPLGIWGAFRDARDVAEAAKVDARLTHPHQVCQDASALFAVTIAAAIRERLSAAQTYEWAIAWANAQEVHESVRGAVEAARHVPPSDYERQQGWVLIALQNAFFQLAHAGDLEKGVVATVRAGGDTDTNAAICGALLGAVYGRPSVPTQWRQMVLSCRAVAGLEGMRQPRPAMVWPTDALVLAERLLASGVRG